MSCSIFSSRDQLRAHADATDVGRTCRASVSPCADLHDWSVPPPVDSSAIPQRRSAPPAAPVTDRRSQAETAAPQLLLIPKMVANAAADAVISPVHRTPGDALKPRVHGIPGIARSGAILFVRHHNPAPYSRCNPFADSRASDVTSLEKAGLSDQRSPS